MWGWAALTILAYLTYKYGPRAGKEPVPQLSDLLHERRANSGLYAIGVAFLAVLLGIGMGHAVLAAAAGVALSLFSLWYMSLIALVFAK